MRVAFYIGRFNRGGAETLLLDIFSRKDTLPFDPVCIYRSEGTLSESFHETKVPLIRLPRNKSWLIYSLRLRRLLKKEKIDIVHAQTSLNAIIAILCTFGTGIKVVNTFHGFSFSSASKWLRRFVFKGCGRLIFVSEYEKNHYLLRGEFGAKNKCAVVYNGVNFEKFQLQRKQKENDFVVEMGMVGSFGEGRNHYFICQFLDYLKKRGENFHFSFIGASRPSELPLYEKCVSFCKEHGLVENVTFVGLSNNVPGLLKKMDLFIYATRHDSFGIAVIEAIAAGVPTIVNDWEVMKEITNQGEYASLFPTDNITSLYELYHDFVIHRQSWIEKAYQSAIEVRRRYDIDRHIACLEQEYELVMDSK